MTIPIHATTTGITPKPPGFRLGTKCSPVLRPMAPRPPILKTTPATTGPATRVRPRAEPTATSMPPMAGSTPRSVFPTAMAAAAVPGTPLTERAAVPKRICRKPTASACFTVSRLTRTAEKAMIRPHAYVVVLCTLMLASCLMLAQQNAPNTQGIAPPPGGPTPPPARMTFFVTSVGLGKGGDLGGLAGADAHCQALAAAVGAGGHTWHAYLSTQARPGQPAVNAR